MRTANSLNAITPRGWWAGFSNLFQATNASWWHTKKWLVQMVLWLLLLNGMLAGVLWSTPAGTAALSADALVSFNSAKALQENPITMAFMDFMIFSALALPIAAIIAGQDAIIRERKSGTAAWILSKPVSRTAFILAKMAANGIGSMVIGVVVQFALAYLQLSLRTGFAWPVAGFLGMTVLAFLNMLFYLTLTYMLGTFFTNTGPVLGISLAVSLLGPSMLRGLPIIRDLTPWTFFIPIVDEMTSGLSLAFGQPVESVLPIIGTAVMSLVFIAITILRFRKEEF
ncbi:MAG: ABC transporter permease subunit [Anaerolineales bacterium]|nr:ABC transporter permease subunit [Anaerolineales bacterium]